MWEKNDLAAWFAFFLLGVSETARSGKAAGVSPASAYKLIADLERLGLLREITGGSRYDGIPLWCHRARHVVGVTTANDRFGSKQRIVSPSEQMTLYLPRH